MAKLPLYSRQIPTSLRQKLPIAYFDDETQIWSEKYWEKWYRSLNSHIIPLERRNQDQIEVGAPPLKTKYGWLLVYCYIQNYFSSPPIFGVEAALLNLNNPTEDNCPHEKAPTDTTGRIREIRTRTEYRFPIGRNC